MAPSIMTPLLSSRNGSQTESMKRRDTTWCRIANQFRRQRLPSDIDEENTTQSDLDTVWQQESSKVDEAWDRTRELVQRGNAAGAVASLTLFGSQQLGGRGPHLSVLLSLCLFIVGLGVLLLRQLVIIWHRHSQKKEKVLAVAADYWDVYKPPPFIMNLARIMDWISFILMVIGIFFGLYVLYGLTLLRG